MITTLAIAFLVVQGVGVLVWWAVMLFVPVARPLFMAPDAPDSTLFAFLPADGLVYAGASLLAAWGLARNRSWGWPVLCAAAGATIYAALYGLALPVVSGGGGLAGALMLPGLVIMPLLAWLLRPGATT